MTYFRFRYLTQLEIEFLQSVRVQASRGLSLGSFATRTPNDGAISSFSYCETNDNRPPSFCFHAWNLLCLDYSASSFSAIKNITKSKQAKNMQTTIR